ncbi:MAG: CDP-alcohol phosphatidyltransferase family protein [Polyangiaceae bacterium]|nr:CDP-alcohol phosphatidyltransferase family protein [Polyangiaceae bacterium]
MNLHVHRPLQLVLVRLLTWRDAAGMRRALFTPNQVTALSLACGISAATCIVAGTPVTLLVAAALIFASAILDGVDGMIARLTRSGSEAGHAIDGAADYLVNVTTTAAAAYYLADHGWPLFVAAGLALGAHLCWANHLMLYDFQAATYLRFATAGKHKGGNPEQAATALAGLRASSGPRLTRFVMRIYLWQLGNRDRLLSRVNPAAPGYQALAVDDDVRASFLASHRPSMRLWALLGNAPHMDLMTLACVTGRFEVYFALRIVAFTVLALVAVAWQRRVSRRFLGALAADAPVVGVEAT